MKTYIIDTIGEKEAVRIDELLHMLDPKAPQTGRERLEELTGNGRLLLFVTEHNDTLAGMLTLTYCDTLARRKYWIEDVIVDEAFRGLGIGRELVQAAVAYVCGRVPRFRNCRAYLRKSRRGRTSLPLLPPRQAARRWSCAFRRSRLHR